MEDSEEVTIVEDTDIMELPKPEKQVQSTNPFDLFTNFSMPTGFNLQDVLAAILKEEKILDDSCNIPNMDEVKTLDFDMNELTTKMQEVMKASDELESKMTTLNGRHNKYLVTLDDDDAVILVDDSQIRSRNTYTPRTVHNMKPGPATYSKADQDVIYTRSSLTVRPNLPPVGRYKYKELTLGMEVYAMKASQYGIWYRAHIIEVYQAASEKSYKVRFDTRRMQHQPTRNMIGKHLAYKETAPILLTVGMRIIAAYRDEQWKNSSQLYAGIIAEPPSAINKFRYLVFFDDGYAQYIPHNEIFVVCEANKDVWEDVHQDSREFIKSYVQQYPERPMLKMQRDQIIKTEWNGKWWIARVADIDASLVKMHFDADARSEWIYRGSTRLAPLFNELTNKENNLASGKIKRHNVYVKTGKNTPYVEYTRLAEKDDGEPKVREGANDAYLFKDDIEDVSSYMGTVPKPAPKLNMAKKSTASSSSGASSSSTYQQYHHNHHKSEITRIQSIRAENEGYVEYKESAATSAASQSVYFEHDCNPKCLPYSDNPEVYKGKNFMAIPMYVGWERQICKRKSSTKKCVMYRAPCGRRLRTIEETFQYLKLTDSELTVDLFSFDISVNCFGEFVPANPLAYLKDISYGKENIPVSCVNSLNRVYPEYVEYSTERLPAKGVHLETDINFLTCCDCTDYCESDQCACRKLTIDATGPHSGGRDPSAGYYFRRINEQVVTGIYECNTRCSCDKRCLNRVVQHGLQIKLQVFKTEKRGWGIRCLNDVPAGSFICIYAGQLLTDEGANEDGKQFGDEYLAELDYIEVVEKMKEGYEAECVDPYEEKIAKDSKKSEKHYKTYKKEEPEEEDDPEDEHEEMDDYSGDDDSDFEVKNPNKKISNLNPRERSQRARKSGSSNKGSEDNEGHKKKRGCKRKQSTEETSDDNMSVDLNLKSLTDTENSNQEWTKKEIKEEDRDSSRSRSKSRSSRGRSRSRSRGPRSRSKSRSRRSRSRSRPRRSSSQNRKGENSEEESSSHETEEVKPLRAHQKFNATNRLCPPEPLEDGAEDTPSEHPSVRNFFGDEFCYIMDAKSIGNIGRYLNHSCCPNVFVQNVFVDSHDLRFPWVAFFGMQYIRAGSELTWDYNYDVGSVPNKVLYCHCGATECRGRLL